MSQTLQRLLLLPIASIGVLAACFSDRTPVDNNNLGSDCRFSPSSAVPGTTVVAIRNLAFTPGEIRIRAGGTVTWVNCEAAGAESHTSTADQGEWSSASLTAGSLFSHQFAQPGRYTYHCVPHPFMTATVVVE